MYEGHFIKISLILSYANDQNNDFLVANMRAEHLPFNKLGSSVCAPATCFDEPGEIPYSRERFGDDWESAVMFGRIRRKLKSYVMVCWDDIILRKASFEDIELHWNDLLVAETRLNHRSSTNLPNYVGGSTGKISDRPQNSSHSTSTDYDAPLKRVPPKTSAPLEVSAPVDSGENPYADSST